MQKQKLFSSLTLAAMVAAGLSTAALAQEGPPAGAGMEMNFDALDADKDGKVTQAEIDAAMKAKFDAADTNKDGKLSADELLAMREQARAERQAAMASKMIERMDSDGDGLLSPEELAAGPQKQSMFDRLDADKDGAVSKEEVEAAKDMMGKRMGGKGGENGRGGDHERGEGHGRGGDHERGEGRDGGRGGFWQWWSDDN